MLIQTFPLSLALALLSGTCGSGATQIDHRDSNSLNIASLGDIARSSYHYHDIGSDPWRATAAVSRPPAFHQQAPVDLASPHSPAWAPVLPHLRRRRPGKDKEQAQASAGSSPTDRFGMKLTNLENHADAIVQKGRKYDGNTKDLPVDLVADPPKAMASVKQQEAIAQKNVPKKTRKFPGVLAAAEVPEHHEAVASTSITHTYGKKEDGQYAGPQGAHLTNENTKDALERCAEAYGGRHVFNGNCAEPSLHEQIVKDSKEAMPPGTNIVAVNRKGDPVEPCSGRAGQREFGCYEFLKMVQIDMKDRPAEVERIKKEEAVWREQYRVEEEAPLRIKLEAKPASRPPTPPPQRRRAVTAYPRRYIVRRQW